MYLWSGIRSSDRVVLSVAESVITSTNEALSIFRRMQRAPSGVPSERRPPAYYCPDDGADVHTDATIESATNSSSEPHKLLLLHQQQPQHDASQPAIAVHIVSGGTSKFNYCSTRPSGFPNCQQPNCSSNSTTSPTTAIDLSTAKVLQQQQQQHFSNSQLLSEQGHQVVKGEKADDVGMPRSPSRDSLATDLSLLSLSRWIPDLFYTSPRINSRKEIK